MEPLNFPVFDLDFRIDEQKKFIFDRVRKKIIPLTPEEWVRQHCIAFLMEYFQVSPNLISVERQIKYLEKSKRFDIVSFKPNGEAQLLIECKAPSVSLTPLVITQAGQYLQKLDCEYLWLTNGIQHIWFYKKEDRFEMIPFPQTL